MDALVVQPETRYAKAGDIHIAYQVFGDGPIDMVLRPRVLALDRGAVGSAGPRARSSSASARSARLISLRPARQRRLRPRRLDELTSLDLWMDDIRVVMDDRRVGERRLLRHRRRRDDEPCCTRRLTRTGVRARPREQLCSHRRGRRTIRGGALPELEEEVLDVMRSGLGQGRLPRPDGAEPRRRRGNSGSGGRATSVSGRSPGTVLSMRKMFGQIDVRDVLLEHPRADARPASGRDALGPRRARPVPRRAHRGAQGSSRSRERPLLVHGLPEPILREIERFVAGIAGPPTSRTRQLVDGALHRHRRLDGSSQRSSATLAGATCSSGTT